MGLSPGKVHQRTYVIQTPQNTSPYIGCLNNKLTYDTEYGKFNRQEQSGSLQLQQMKSSKMKPLGDAMKGNLPLNKLPTMATDRLYHHEHWVVD